MRRRALAVITNVVVVGAGCVFCVRWCLLFSGWDAFYGALFIVGLPLSILLARDLSREDRSHLRMQWHEFLRARRFVRWQIGGVLSLGLMFLCGALWLKGYWLVHYANFPLAGRKFVAINFSVGEVSVTLGFDARRTGSEGVSLRSFRVTDLCPLSSVDKSGRLVTVSRRKYRPPFWERYNITSGGVVRRGAKVSIPYWVLVGIFGVAPGSCLWRGYRRYRREGTNRCLECGYDLTGNISGVCPECGAGVPTQESPNRP